MGYEAKKTELSRTPGGASRTNWPYSVAQFDFSPTGTLVYIPLSSPSQAGALPARHREIRVVVNWFEELKQKTGAVQ